MDLKTILTYGHTYIYANKWYKFRIQSGNTVCILNMQTNYRER